MPETKPGTVVTAAEREQYLRERIPLSRAMAVEIRSTGTDGVEIYAPLASNHQSSRDGVRWPRVGGGHSRGVVRAARVPACGGHRRAHRHPAQHDELRTVDHHGLYGATVTPPDGDEWTKLVATLQRGRPAPVRVGAQLLCEGQFVGKLDGEFAVLPTR